MYFFTPDTIVKANEHIKSLDPKIGGLLCVLHCLVKNVEENVSYEIDGEKLRKQLSLVFDKTPRESFENAKSSYIIFAKNWVSTFFDNYIKHRVDLLSCAIFFLRRYGFEKECTKEEVIEIFIERFNLKNIKDYWFCDSSDIELVYNQHSVEDNQTEFYAKMEYTSNFKSILFSDVIQKSAADLKAAGQIQTLYSGSGIHSCFLLSNEPLDKYYIMNKFNSKKSINNDEEIFNHSVYGIHIKLQNDALSDDTPHICIGWSGMGDLSDITNKEELVSKYDATWSDVKPRKKGQDIGQVWRFIKEMQIGDFVVFSCGDTCHIGRITSDYYFDDTANENQHPDYTNVRDVDWLKKDIRKSDLSQALQNSLGAAMSVFSLNDYKSAILDLLNDTYAKDSLDVSEDDEIEVVAEETSESFTVEELSKILSEMYNSSDNKTTAIHMFGLKYADAITYNGYTASEVVKASDISDSYHVEVSKGISIYKSIRKNEFGIRFADDDAIVETPKVICETLPVLHKRSRKFFELNSILYGAPGTGKTYETAKYALAITEGKALGEYKDTSRKDVMGKYNQLIKDGQVVFTTFHQNYGYEDFIQGIRPDTATDELRFKTVDGVFKNIAEKAMGAPEKDFVIIIDEINRANISKVFGELITLIEDDKRWGEENAVSVTLPSGERFAVPNNLYIVGTMNSADKSISLIDTALRRRFCFVEFMPDLTLVSDAKLKIILKKLNEGIEKELNSTDLLVGHSYFINKSFDDIDEIMNRSIIPLLYEYFFDNKNKVEAQLKYALEGFDVQIISNTAGRIKIKQKEG